MKPISVMLVDDNPTFLRATAQFIQAHDDLSIVGAVEEGQDALEQVQALRPQVILVDLAMIGMPGLEVIPRLRELMPNAGIIALTLLNTNNFRKAALEAGADAFVPKATMRTDLLPTIRQIVRAEDEKVDQISSDTSAAAARRILVTEDNADLGRLYSKALRKSGYEVHLALTIPEARDLLQSMRFDVLLCDIHMGEDRGTVLLQDYSEKLATSGTQIIMVSGQAQYRGMCEQMGADFFLEKPVAISTLVALVNRLAAR